MWLRCAREAVTSVRYWDVQLFENHGKNAVLRAIAHAWREYCMLGIGFCISVRVTSFPIRGLRYSVLLR
jgi:hypothetical protein